DPQIVDFVLKNIPSNDVANLSYSRRVMFAATVDRKRVRQGRKQIYASSVDCTDLTPETFDEEKINIARQEIGLNKLDYKLREQSCLRQ
ncbi:MAG: hypothetical protein AAGC56_01340, partial [Pseudomonadota bacterium]